MNLRAIPTETTRHQDLPLTVSLETAGGPSPTVLEGVHTYSPLCDSCTGSNTRVSPVWMRTEDPSLVHTSCAVGSPEDHNKIKFSIVIFYFCLMDGVLILQNPRKSMNLALVRPHHIHVVKGL